MAGPFGSGSSHAFRWANQGQHDTEANTAMTRRSSEQAVNKRGGCDAARVGSWLGEPARSQPCAGA